MLTEIEKRVLREIAGDFPNSNWGAAIGAALEILRGNDFITAGYRVELTEKGRRLVNELREDIPIVQKVGRDAIAEEDVVFNFHQNGKERYFFRVASRGTGLAERMKDAFEEMLGADWHVTVVIERPSRFSPASACSHNATSPVNEERSDLGERKTPFPDSQLSSDRNTVKAGFAGDVQEKVTEWYLNRKDGRGVARQFLTEWAAKAVFLDLSPELKPDYHVWSRVVEKTV